MDIRFCDRCSESIPDADFESGRAVTVSHRHYHVSCALTRSLALTGSRAWLTFVLAVYAAGITTFLLVAALARNDTPRTVPPVVEKRIQEVVKDARAAVSTETAGLLARQDATAARDRRSALDQLRKETEQGLTDLGGRIDEHERVANDQIQALKLQVQSQAKELGELSALLREVARRAEAEASRRASTAPPTPTPASPEPEKPAPAPTPPKPPATQPTPASPPAQPAPPAAELQRWIDRLKDSNENIRFSATLELGRLKDLRATAPLIEVLQKDKDYYVRLGAATALGDIHAADAVPVLVEALDDKDTLVRTAANDALQAITGHAVEFQAEMSRRDRGKVQRDWQEWWKANESAVRDRLGQAVHEDK